MTTKPKERGMLFSAPMVRAILAGTKTQTRRMVKPQPFEYDGAWRWKDKFYGAVWDGCGPFEAACPHGSPGSRLWVRETFFSHKWVHHDQRETDVVYYRADGETLPDSGDRWKSPIHMPRKLSRLTLEITSVRVERVQDITDADAIAEGVERHTDEGVTYYGPINAGTANPVGAYADLWDSINGKGSWKSNPWVWVVEFRRVE